MKQGISIISIARDAIKKEAEAVEQLAGCIDEQFEDAVDFLYRCQGKVIITGVGKSGHIGAKIAATLSSTGTPAFALNPMEGMHGDIGVVMEQQRDLVEILVELSPLAVIKG